MSFFRKKKPSLTPDFDAQRARMVRRDLMGRDIEDPTILAAMSRVQRELFMPPDKVSLAYADHPVPIGYRQTISQPYIVALTAQMARPKTTDRALEIGAGSGYASAVLGELVSEVTSLEIVSELADIARDNLARWGAKNVRVVNADAGLGYAASAPFDVIVSAAAPRAIPEVLFEQLAVGGRLVCPVGDWSQRMVSVTKRGDGTLETHRGCAVSFVPLTGCTWRPLDDD